MTLAWLLIVPLLLAVVFAAEVLLRGRKYSPLAGKFARPHVQPGSGPLGMEATDTEAFRRAMRHSGGWGPTSGLGFGNSSNGNGLQDIVSAMPEDESYATRFHAAFGKDKEKRE